jgi:hypothetical protein
MQSLIHVDIPLGRTTLFDAGEPTNAGSTKKARRGVPPGLF